MQSIDSASTPALDSASRMTPAWAAPLGAVKLLLRPSTEGFEQAQRIGDIAGQNQKIVTVILSGQGADPSGIGIKIDMNIR